MSASKLTGHELLPASRCARVRAGETVTLQGCVGHQVRAADSPADPSACRACDAGPTFARLAGVTLRMPAVDGEAVPRG